MEEKDLELIERYLSQQLSDQESKEFEKRLENDNELKKAKEDTESLISGIHYASKKELYQKLQLLDKAMPPYEPEGKVVKWYTNPMAWGVAASISLVIIGWIFFLNPASQDQDDLFAQHFEVYPNIIAPTVRGAEADTAIKKQAYYLYDLGQYQEAIEELSELSKEEDNGAVMLYLGISYLSLNDNENAIRSFEQYRQSQFETFLPQANWYLGLTYLRIGDRNQAKKIWEEIPEGNSYRNKVTEVLSNF